MSHTVLITAYYNLQSFTLKGQIHFVMVFLLQNEDQTSEICFLGSSEVDGFNSVYKTGEDRPRKPTQTLRSFYVSDGVNSNKQCSWSGWAFAYLSEEAAVITSKCFNGSDTVKHKEQFMPFKESRAFWCRLGIKEQKKRILAAMIDIVMTQKLVSTSVSQHQHKNQNWQHHRSWCDLFIRVNIYLFGAVWDSSWRNW